MTIYVRRNRRAIYRAIEALPGWTGTREDDRRNIVATVDRIMSAPARFVDHASSVVIVRSTRRELVLRSF